MYTVASLQGCEYSHRIVYTLVSLYQVVNIDDPCRRPPNLQFGLPEGIQIAHNSNNWRSPQSTNATRPYGHDVHSKYCLPFLMYTSDLRSIPV